jgi:predicted transcriptional regulator/DNA-binding XRE family transcriptional regulator
MAKAFIGPQLRQLRRERGQTQAEMAHTLGVSAAYINMLENNQRSLSVQMLMAVSESYQVDWRNLVKDPPRNLLVDLRNILQDPAFGPEVPDLQELRSAIDHAPRLVDAFVKLHSNYNSTLEKIMRQDEAGPREALAEASPEASIYNFFRSHDNYFDVLEREAEKIREKEQCTSEDIYLVLKNRLKETHGISTKVKPMEDMQEALRLYDKKAKAVYLSEALDFQNRVFQLAHVLCLVEFEEILEQLTSSSGIKNERGIARCKVELANYFAAAFLMPSREFRKTAEKTKYDVERIASKFNCSYEQVCHRLTTLQRPTAKGVPFFFLRIDRAGNVSKRFNSTSFNLAEFGGSCPVWNIHTAFRLPGEVLPQFVELPDGKRYFTLSRTSDRPSFSNETKNHRLTVAIGCEMKYAHLVGYSKAFDFQVPNLFSPIGINCHVCPRQACAQRAHQPMFMELPIDPRRRGNTRYES